MTIISPDFFASPAGEDVWIMGIDPSLTGTGIATDEGQLLTVKTNPATALEERLSELYCATWARADQPYSDYRLLAVMETMPTSARGAGRTTVAHGAVMAAVGSARGNILLLHVMPSSLKKFYTGNGRADKKDMLAEFMTRNGLTEKPKRLDDNMVDAEALRQMGIELVQAASYGSLDAGAREFPHLQFDMIAKVRDWLRNEP